MKASVMEEVKRIFKPEFLNRIDETIVFRALNKDDMKKLSALWCAIYRNAVRNSYRSIWWYGKLQRNLLLKKLMTANTVPDLCAEKVQDEVEDRLADALIRGEIHTGESCDRDDEEQGNHCIKR